MAMISKTANQPMEQKASYAKVSDTVMGGTERSKFTGSNDTRSTGMSGQTKMLKEAPGLINQGPDTMDTSGDAKEFVSGGSQTVHACSGFEFWQSERECLGEYCRNEVERS